MMNPLEHEMQRRANPVAGRHTILLFFLLLVMLSVCCAPGCAAADEIAPGTTTFGISNHTGIIWRSAQIDGDRIVWAERTPGIIPGITAEVHNICLYNFTTGTETLVSSALQDGKARNATMWSVNPVAISGNRIVWITAMGIHMYDITTGKQSTLIENSEDDESHLVFLYPGISGDTIVWTEQQFAAASHKPDIIAYNLTTGKQIIVSHGDWDKTGIRIDGSRIVWEDYRKDGISRDIYLYDLTTGKERVICNATGPQGEPKISGDRIVWSDRRDQNWDVYLYDIATGEERVIATGLKEQEAADISGNRIIWMEWPSMFLYNPYDESNRLMMYDISSGKEYQVLKDIPNMFAPAIYGNRIIFMDLAHIPADQRDKPRQDPVQEISLFTLDPGRFPLSKTTIVTQVNATGSPVPSPGTPPLPKPTPAPGFGTVCALSVFVIGILFIRIRRG
jgi:beta propeller repeat protein